VGGYCDYVFRQGPVKVVAGFRGDYYRLLRDYGISPRCAVSCELPRIGTFAVSGGLYYQEPADLSRQVRNLIVADPNYREWQPLPGFRDIGLQRSWQGVLSYEKQFAASRVLTVESYLKWYDREYTLADPETYRFEEDFYKAIGENRPWRLADPRGRKKAYGLELSFRKKRQRGFYYTLGYALSSVKNRYADGKWYDDANSVRNNGSLLLGLEFLKRHGVSARIYASEGKPYSKIVPSSEQGGMVYDTTAPYYSEQLDPVVSVNMRYSFRFYPRFGTITGYVEAWNLLNYKPVVMRSRGWSGYWDETALGIIPFLGLTADF
jgi:hypothetical protein